MEHFDRQQLAQLVGNVVDALEEAEDKLWDIDEERLVDTVEITLRRFCEVVSDSTYMFLGGRHE